jgi:opacity protein-like surface antigen
MRFRCKLLFVAMSALRFLIWVFVCVGLAGFSLHAASEDHEGFYLGAFGSIGANGSSGLQQRGAVLLPPSSPLPRLPVDARGSTNRKDVVAGGLHVGYEWSRWNLDSDSRWGLKPAAEIEGLFLGKHSPMGEMPVIPRALGTQYVTIPMTASVFTANAVFTIQTPYSERVLPYVGVGIGVASLSIHGADSANPSEPGINHFNSDPDASDTAFALQLKVGVKSEIYKNLSLFAEYRHLSIYSTSYTFGATDYPGLHFPTTPWHVNLGHLQYNLFVMGLQYKF